MNDMRIQKDNHFLFNGFVVQVGMIFGIDDNRRTVVTNGTMHKGGYDVYFSIPKGGDFAKTRVTNESNPMLFSKIQKAVRRRDRIGLDGVSYANSDQLEYERWQADKYNRHFKSACTPIGKTTKVIGGSNPVSEAKYNSMKERNTITKHVNHTRYISGNNKVVII